MWEVGRYENSFISWSLQREIQPAELCLHTQGLKPPAEWGITPAIMVMLTHVVYKIVGVGRFCLGNCIEWR